MSDELRNTWLYQQILKEGQEEGREEERKRLEEERKQELERWRKTLITFVQERFSDQKMERQARGQAAIITDPNVLQSLVLKVGPARTAEEATDYLLSWPQAS